MLLILVEQSQLALSPTFSPSSGDTTITSDDREGADVGAERRMGGGESRFFALISTFVELAAA